VIALCEDFETMSREDKVNYLIENRHILPKELIDTGINLLIGAGETECAISLAKENGQIEKAIEIAVVEGDYLWAAMIAKKAGLGEEKTEKLYKEGLEYYVSMNMYGRAVSVAQALQLPQHIIDQLFQEGIRAESKNMNMEHVRSALDNITMTLERTLTNMDDDLSQELLNAMREEKENSEKRDP